MFVNEQNEKENAQLSWTWVLESMKDILQRNGKFKKNILLKQKEITYNFSDYLWYMTNFDTNTTSSFQNVTLRVNTNGHVLHAFTNRRYIWSH